MARIRNIKPEFFVSESVAELPLRTRLTWIGLWTHCDNHGRARDNVRTIKGAVWPLDDDVSLDDIEQDLRLLALKRRLIRYVVDGKRFLVITNWGEHQYGAFKDKPKFPGPDDSGARLDESGSTEDAHPVDNSVSGDEKTHGPGDQEKSRDLLEKSGHGEEKCSGIQVSSVRGQGRGTRDARPSSNCPKHENDPNPPACRGCGAARLAAEAWDAEYAADTRPAIRRCQMCDGEGFRWDPAGRHRGPTRDRCDHRPMVVAS